MEGGGEGEEGVLLKWVGGQRGRGQVSRDDEGGTMWRGQKGSEGWR